MTTSAKANYGHYTSLTGLIGIVSSQTLWATNIKFLNDEQEFQHALQLGRSILESPKNIPASKPELYKEFISTVDKSLKSLDYYRSEAVFTISFSESTDLLSQWRGYCPDNNGYCVVYNVDAVLAAVKAIFSDAVLLPCIYDDNEKVKKLKDLLNSYWHSYVAAKTKKAKEECTDSFVQDLVLLAAHFKHSSYSEEKEHRIIVISDGTPIPHLAFRPGRFSLIPYISIPASRECITSICIGPTAQPHLAKRALEAFLEYEFEFPITIFGDIKVTHSNTPYRPC